LPSHICGKCIFFIKKLLSHSASLTPLGALCGSLLSSYPLAKLGRKNTLLISAAMFAFAFVLLGSSSMTESVALILVARGMMGGSVGLAIPASQIYVSPIKK
jgi:MFS family permease